MQRLSQKEVVLLGLIAEQAIHAYGLEEKIHARSMEDWTTISKSSIYRVLQHLEQRGLITSRLEHEGQGATRKVYQINEAGALALSEGVLGLLGYCEPYKDPFMVGLSYSYFARHDQVIDQLQKRIEAFRVKTSCLRDIRDRSLEEVRKNERACAHGVDTVVEMYFTHAIEHVLLEVDLLERDIVELKAAKAERLETNTSEPV
jgi:DNA-binding PadR family transcriptional regulator